MIPDLKIVCVRALADGGKVVGKTIASANIRQVYQVNVLAISRKETMKKISESNISVNKLITNSVITM